MNIPWLSLINSLELHLIEIFLMEWWLNESILYCVVLRCSFSYLSSILVLGDQVGKIGKSHQMHHQLFETWEFFFVFIFFHFFIYDKSHSFLRLALVMQICVLTTLQSGLFHVNWEGFVPFNHIISICFCDEGFPIVDIFPFYLY